MNIKFAHVLNALVKLRDEIGSDNIKNNSIEITLVEDDPGAGNMIGCIKLFYRTSYLPSSYDSYRTNTDKEFTIEIFPDSENRAPRLTTLSTRELDPDKKS